MKALVLIDFQNEWINEKSPYFVWNIQNALKKVNKLIKYCRKNEYKIILTKHIELESDYSFKKWTNNSEIIWSLNLDKKDVVIEKNKISPFYMTKLDKELAWTDEVVVCWILTNLCVRSFIEWAYDREMDIKVIKDCCVSFDKQTQNFTFKDLKETRKEIEFINLKDFIN